MIPRELLIALGYKTRTTNGFNYVLEAEGMWIVDLQPTADGEIVVVADDEGNRGTVEFKDDGRRV